MFSNVREQKWFCLVAPPPVLYWIFSIPPTLPAGRFADEGASPAQLLDQVPGDVAELGGEILVNVEDVHLKSW